MASIEQELERARLAEEQRKAEIAQQEHEAELDRLKRSSAEKTKTYVRVSRFEGEQESPEAKKSDDPS